MISIKCQVIEINRKFTNWKGKLIVQIPNPVFCYAFTPELSERLFFSIQNAFAYIVINPKH